MTANGHEPDSPDYSSSIFCTITKLLVDGEEAPQEFELNFRNKETISIGRATDKNDVVLVGKGISAFHAELVLRKKGEEPEVCLKDISTNGIGFEIPDQPLPIRGEKDQLVPLPSECVLLLPMKVKAGQGLDGPARCRLKLKIEGLPEKPVVESSVPVPKTGLGALFAAAPAAMEKPPEQPVETPATVVPLTPQVEPQPRRVKRVKINRVKAVVDAPQQDAEHQEASKPSASQENTRHQEVPPKQDLAEKNVSAFKCSASFSSDATKEPEPRKNITNGKAQTEEKDDAGKFGSDSESNNGERDYKKKSTEGNAKGHPDEDFEPRVLKEAEEEAAVEIAEVKREVAGPQPEASLQPKKRARIKLTRN